MSTMLHDAAEHSRAGEFAQATELLARVSELIAKAVGPAALRAGVETGQVRVEEPEPAKQEVGFVSNKSKGAGAGGYL